MNAPYENPQQHGNNLEQGGWAQADQLFMVDLREQIANRLNDAI